MGADWDQIPVEHCMEAIIDYRGKSPAKTKFGIPLITAKVIKGGRIEAPNEFIDPADYDAWMRRGIPKAGDVVLTTEAPLGEVAQLDGNKVALAQRVIALRGKAGLLDNTFLKFVLQSEGIKQQLYGRSTGTTVHGIRQSELRKVVLPVPSFPEQQAIAHILGTLDDKIELNRRMSETLEAMVRALFKSWFVDFDPVRAKAEGRDTGLPKEIADVFPDRFVDSELGEVPEGWDIKPLDEIAQFQNGLALQKYRPKNDLDRLPVVKIAQLRSGKADSGEWATSALKPEHVIDDGDVVFSWSGSLLVRVWCGGRAALNQHLFKVTSKDFPRWFYLDVLLWHLPEFRRIAAGKATTMGHIQRHHLSDAFFVVPLKRTLDAGGRIFSALVDRTIVLELNSRSLAELRDSLLPKLISGELRVNDVESIAHMRAQ